jgi:hypothetical protein
MNAELTGLVVAIMVLVLLALAAMRFGTDSRRFGQDRPNWS